MSKLPTARTIRVPDLTLNVQGATVINGGARLSVSAFATPDTGEHLQTLAGSVRGPKEKVGVSPVIEPSSGTIRPGRPMKRIVKAVLRTTRNSW